MTDAREPDSSAAWRSPDLEIKIGISSCLLGEAVRYDGGHQKDSYITGALSRHFTFVSVCPEMELGLGAPRETLRLVGDATAPRLVATQSGTDLTQARLRALIESATKAGDIAGFHTAHKFLLLAHRPVDSAHLGRLLGNLQGLPRAACLARYGEGFMRALTVRATPRKHVTVLRHIMGFFKGRLSAEENRELGGLIGDFGRGLVPLVVPITLINLYVARFGVAYVADQIYLSPHPKELMLRSV